MKVGGSDIQPATGQVLINRACTDRLQRQTTISQFFQMDKLVVEGQKTVCYSHPLSSNGVVSDNLRRESKQEERAISSVRRILGKYCGMVNIRPVGF